MNESSTTRLWVLVAALASLVVALVTAMLKTSVGTSPANAALAGGTAFATAFGLALGILGALRHKNLPGRAWYSPSRVTECDRSRRDPSRGSQSGVGQSRA